MSSRKRQPDMWLALELRQNSGFLDQYISSEVVHYGFDTSGRQQHYVRVLHTYPAIKAHKWRTSILLIAFNAPVVNDRI